MRNTFDVAPSSAAEVARFLLTAHVSPVGLVPTRGDPSGHAHGDQRFGVASAGFCEAAANDGCFRRSPGGRSHENFGEQGQRNEDNRSCQCRQSDQRVEGEADCEIKRNPRQVE